MGDQIQVKYVGPSGAFEDSDGEVYEKNVVTAVSDEKAEYLLSLPEEYAFSEASKEEYDKIEDDARIAEEVADATAKREAKNAEEAAKRDAYYNADSQVEIDEAVPEAEPEKSEAPAELETPVEKPKKPSKPAPPAPPVRSQEVPQA